MQPENPTHYALAKVYEVSHVIALAVQELPVMRNKMEKFIAVNKERARGCYEDIQKLLSRLTNALTQAYLSLMEMDETALAGYTLKLINSVKAFNIMTPDYSKLCNVLCSYSEQLPSQSQTTNARVIGRLMNRVKLGYYPTDLEHIGHIERAIEFPQGITTNLFDPCCGCGLALRSLAEGNNCYAYGVELDEGRAEEALTRLHRVGIGSFFYSRVSNEAFHAMLLNPPYLSVLSEEGQKFRSEKRFLVDAIHHLMIGGLLIYIIPYYRMTDDICRVLSDNFSDISVWKFYGNEYKKFKQVAVMGVRKKRQSDMEKALELSSLVYQIEEIPELCEIPEGRYALPKETRRVDIFKGAVFNIAELAEQLKSSNSFSRLFQKNKLDSINKRPLLPLSIGQVGLIGGSGLINGLIECETPHILKGRIVKEAYRKEEQTENQTGRRVTNESIIRSNKMIFNILTTQGFRSLS